MIARAIVHYRTQPQTPPFRTLYDLYRVPELVEAMGGDFTSQYALMVRISNMVTTRSDSFVVYLLVQGWRDFGTSNTRVETERRAAFVIDRSAVTRDQQMLQSLKIPTN